MSDLKKWQESEQDAVKQPYETPTLKKVGNVADVTQGPIGSGADSLLLGSH